MKKDTPLSQVQLPKLSDDWERIRYRLTRDDDKLVFVCVTGSRSVIS